MNKFIRRAAMAALVSAASATAVTALMSAQAAVPQRTGPNAKAAAAKETGPQVRGPVGKPLNDAMKLVDTKDFAGALAKVREADAVMDKTPFEEYQVTKYMGFIAINQAMPDYAAATVAYNRQITSGGAPDAEKPNMYNIAMRLNYQAMDYASVIKDAAELQKLMPLDDTGYLVLIQSYYNTNDFKNAATAGQRRDRSEGGNRGQNRRQHEADGRCARSALECSDQEHGRGRRASDFGPARHDLGKAGSLGPGDGFRAWHDGHLGPSAA